MRGISQELRGRGASARPQQHRIHDAPKNELSTTAQLCHAQRKTMEVDGHASSMGSAPSPMGSVASWKTGPEAVLLQCEALCQQILGAVQADVLNGDGGARSDDDEQDFRSKATVCLPSL